MITGQREFCVNRHDLAEVGTKLDAKGHRRCNACAQAAKVRRRRPPRTHCARGHRFTKNNTHTWVDAQGRSHRKCRICAAASARARKENRAA